MQYFIGIDIGTSSSKAVAFSAEGAVLAKHAVNYGISHPMPGWSEQDPDEIIEAVVSSLHHIAGSLNGHHPVLVSFSAAMHNLIAVSADDRPLTHCIIWADNRAVDIAEELRLTAMGQECYHSTGVPVHAMSPLCKLIWLRQHRPGIFSAASKFIGIKEYLFHALFGKYIIDTGIASATGLLNIHSLEWDEQILQFVAINQQQLSTLVKPGHIEFLPPVSRCDPRLVPFEKTAFVAGGSDGGLANLGSGATFEGSMAVTIGTSGAARMVTHGVFTDTAMRTFCYHLQQDRYITGGASNNGAVVLQWLKEAIFQQEESMDSFFSHAATVPPGCDDLIFLPYILGERAPLWNSNARGIFFGLSILHGKPHMIRAAMEAVIFNLYSIGRVLMERVPVTTIFANGGFANNTLWIQMLADVFNVTVFVNEIEESSAWGAVLMGMEALGNIPLPLYGTEGKKYEPNPANHQLYLKCFTKFERIYGLVKSEFTGHALPVIVP